MVIQKCAAYDSYARLGLANSERIVWQIPSDAFKRKNIFKKKYAAYDSYARLGLANSERIVWQIRSDAFNRKTSSFFSFGRLVVC